MYSILCQIRYFIFYTGKPFQSKHTTLSWITIIALASILGKVWVSYLSQFSVHGALYSKQDLLPDPGWCGGSIAGHCRVNQTKKCECTCKDRIWRSATWHEWLNEWEQVECSESLHHTDRPSVKCSIQKLNSWSSENYFFGVHGPVV